MTTPPRVLTPAEVAKICGPHLGTRINNLCDSHEHLRARAETAERVLAELDDWLESLGAWGTTAATVRAKLATLIEGAE